MLPDVSRNTFTFPIETLRTAALDMESDWGQSPVLVATSEFASLPQLENAAIQIPIKTNRFIMVRYRSRYLWLSFTKPFDSSKWAIDRVDRTGHGNSQIENTQKYC
jgi:hypothetical protein